jgi:cytochrome c551/c552
MKMIQPVLALAAGAVLSGVAHAGVTDAEAKPLLAKYNCRACHSPARGREFESRRPDQQ